MLLQLGRIIITGHTIKWRLSNMLSEIQNDQLNNRTQLVIRLTEDEVNGLINGVSGASLENIVKKLSDAVYEKYKNEIMAKLDLDKIARMVENYTKIRIMKEDLKLNFKKKAK